MISYIKHIKVDMKSLYDSNVTYHFESSIFEGFQRHFTINELH